jgi:hypothetical protein
MALGIPSKREQVWLKLLSLSGNPLDAVTLTYQDIIDLKVPIRNFGTIQQLLPSSHFNPNQPLHNQENPSELTPTQLPQQHNVETNPQERTTLDLWPLQTQENPSELTSQFPKQHNVETNPQQETSLDMWPSTTAEENSIYTFDHYDSFSADLERDYESTDYLFSSLN